MNTKDLVVAEGNEFQLQAWNGDEGAAWAARAQRFDATVRRHEATLIKAAAIAPNEHVLDIGCGTGQSTRDAARLATAGDALGIDLSSQMLAVAADLATAERLTNASFLHADAQIHSFAPQTFDVVISRNGAQFFADQVAAFTNLFRALRSGGRVAFLSWQDLAHNEWLSAIIDALTLGRGAGTPPAGAPGPFGHALPPVTTEHLTKAGFIDIVFEDVPLPLYWGPSVDEAHTFISETMTWLMTALDEDEQRTALDRLRATLSEHDGPDGVAFDSRAWLITARRP